MADTTYYVNTASTPGGTGLTNATTGDARAFASLNEAEGLNLNLTTGATDGVCTINCTGSTDDTTAVNFNGWTVDAGGYPNIIGDNTGGKWDTSKYILSTGTGAATFSSNLNYLRATSLQATNSGTATTDNVFIRLGYRNANRFIKCIAKGGYNGFLTKTDGSTDGDDLFINCIAYEATKTGFNIPSTSGHSIYAYNCTSYGNNVGNSDYTYNFAGANSYAINCVGMGLTAYGTYKADFSAITETYCISDDATANGTGCLANQTVADMQWTDAANGDFSIGATSIAVGAGLDDPGSGLYSDDITGTARSSTWDIGADEYVASGNAYTAAGSLSSAGALSRMIHVARTYAGELMEWTKQLFSGWRQYVFNSMAQNFSEGR